MTTQTDHSDIAVSAEARTFVIAATGASLLAFDIGFDAGAFSNIDHRHLWAAWVLCTVAMISSFLFNGSDHHIGWHWKTALLVPTVWLGTGLFFDLTNTAVLATLGGITALSLPFAAYTVARFVAGDYFSLTPRLRIALGMIATAMLAAGWIIGTQHTQYLTCQDFERAGEFQPDNCTPDR